MSEGMFHHQLKEMFYFLRLEFSTISTGILFFQIRNNEIGKFGITFDPLYMARNTGPLGLSRAQQEVLYTKLSELIKLKKHWTHGEITVSFRLEGEQIETNVQFQSNYNMSHLKK